MEVVNLFLNLSGDHSFVVLLKDLTFFSVILEMLY